MTSSDIREKFIKFFEERGHTRIPSASVVPENDPSVLFTTAGMHPLVPFLLGEKHPAGNRLVNTQKCIRTGDIDEVGDDTHLTFFEMLGNWSLGDYFKKDAIKWSYEFLTDSKWLGLDPKRIYVTVFEGDELVPRDDESITIWTTTFESAGIKATVGENRVGVVGNARIFPYGRDKNWWGPAGETGPCGPDSEMFYDTGQEHDKSFGAVCHPNCECGRFVEIWNDVFMQYNKTKSGEFVALNQRNVDTGMGLERMTAIMQGKRSMYETDLFDSVISEIKKMSGETLYDERSARIIADHIRATVFMASDHVQPANIGQGYVMRRLIRRATMHARKIGMDTANYSQFVARQVISVMGSSYPEIGDKQEEIISIIQLEVTKFRQTLERGLKELTKMAAEGELSGEQIFVLFDTYGLPPEITQEEVAARGYELAADWQDRFTEKMEEQKMRSQTATAGVFKGGLADHSEQTTWYHTLTHLTYAALRKVLGDHVHQRGSNLTAERMRFDFSHPEKMTDEQKAEVEKYVNESISAGADVSYQEIPTSEAQANGALGEFGHKYGDKVKVYTVKDSSGKVWSYEICGGPHVTNTSDIKGTYRIKKEESVAAGIRRIKAIIQ